MSKNPITIFIAGDSTASNYEKDKYPMHGWGQVLGELFDEGIKVENKATPGRSTKSFIDEGRLKEIEDTLIDGDYLFIQFGHNDEKIEDNTRYTEPFTTYKDNLKIFITTAQEKGSIPILLTSIARRHFDENGSLKNTHGDYLVAMMEVAIELDIPLIDLHKRTQELIISEGDETSKKYFMWLEPNQYDGYPEGVKDNTHLNKLGATAIAKIALDGIRKLGLDISKYISS